jgi:type II secretory pathway predicted ATPase ExeA
MYLEHWRLTKPPFDHAVDRNHLFEATSQEEALARLHFLVEYRHPIGTLTGPSGSGKSLLLEVLQQRLASRQRRVIHLKVAASTLHEAWWQLADGLQLAPSPRDTTFSLWRNIEAALHRNRVLRQDSVIIFDDLDQADRECILGVTRLAAMNRWPEARTTLILSGTVELVSMAPRLVRQAELKIELEPFTVADTQSYLRHCLHRAGRSAACFTNAAVAKLHELAHGMPREVNHLAELALVAAAAQRLACVDTETVVGAAQEMSRSRLPQVA